MQNELMITKIQGLYKLGLIAYGTRGRLGWARNHGAHDRCQVEENQSGEKQSNECIPESSWF